MRRPATVLAAVAIAVAACGGSSGDDDGEDRGDGEAPTVAISEVTIGDGGTAVLAYAFRDDGPVRVEIDWGDGSPLQGFTGESGSFSSRHVYETAATSVVVTIVTIDADGNTSAATRTIDLTGTSTTVASTVPATTDVASTVAESTSTTSTTASTTSTTVTTTTSPPPPPPDPTTTTSTTTTTTTLEPRNYEVTVRGDEIRVLGDCEGPTGGRGDFVITGAFVAGNSGRQTFAIGRTSNPEQIGEGESRSIAGTVARTEVADGVEVEWGATFTVTEYDVGIPRQPDPSMNSRSRPTSDVITTPGSRRTRSLFVGSGSCQVEMRFVVTAEYVD